MYTMNRCFRPSFTRATAVLAASLVVFAQPLGAQTLDPQRIPPMAKHAQRGVLRVMAPPEVLLNGQPARLAPGARIRDRNNLLVVSGALLGQDLVVRYTRDPLGLLHEVWVLTPREAAVGMPPPPRLDSSY
jgi:hypothetical protein